MTRQVQLQRINSINRALVCALEVAPEQQRWIWDNSRTLSFLHEWEAAGSETVPLAVFAEGRPVGFVMYTHDSRTSTCFIDRLMIDHREQGKGWGRAALAVLLSHLHKRAAGAPITVAVESDNQVAKRLYQSAGFRLSHVRPDDPDHEVWAFEHDPPVL